MESNGESVDDQGTGWFEVKKKHRSSSKFSLQGWVGGISGRNASNPLHGRPSLSDSGGNSRDKHGYNLPKGREDCSVPVPGRGGIRCSVSVSNDNKQNVNCINNNVVNKAPEFPMSPDLGIGSSSGGIESCARVYQKDSVDLVHKVNLVPHLDKSAGVGIKFGAIGDDNLMACRDNDSNRSVVSCASSCTTSQEKTLVAAAVPANVISDQMHQVSPQGPRLENNHDQLPEVIVKNVVVPSVDENTDDQDSSDQVKEVNDDFLTSSRSIGIDAEIVVKVEDPVVVTVEVSDQGIPKALMMDEDLGEPAVTEENLELFSTSDSEPKVSEEPPTSSGFAGDQVVSHDDATANAQNASPLGESDTVESKERFRQRLWCFLFENLNRAVDELYLLCELECDVEQMKEAILVLDEAASDFKDLTSRVEEFESMKRSSPNFNNGAPINLKSDHRRPHALSWEVRRMTTSAHKAEILSSSLEAFKKIQRERATLHQSIDAKILLNPESGDCQKSSTSNDGIPRDEDLSNVVSTEPQDTKLANSRKLTSMTNGHVSPQVSSQDLISSKLPPRDSSAVGKSKREQSGFEAEKLVPKKVKMMADGVSEKNPKSTDLPKRQIPPSEQHREKEKKNSNPWKSMDAWKEKRNWQDILASPYRVSSRISHSPGLSRKSAERARILHDKLMSPEKKKKTAIDLKREAAEKHARAMRIRSELENERAQKLQRTSEKLNRVSEWQAVRSMKLRQGMYARQQRSESRHEAFLAQVVKRAGDESSKVNEVRFITSLNEENKKLILRQKLHDSELRRAEKLQVMKSKQKEDMAREEAVLERRKLIEAEKLQRLAETQRRKEEAQIRREEERKASSAAREARALEQLRRKEERAKAQQEEAELLAQKLAEKLSESEQRRKFYLEQIRERASINFRDQSSPLLRRSINKEGQGRSTPTTTTSEDNQTSSSIGLGDSTLVTGSVALQHSMKRRIKRIRQRLMALKYEIPEPPVSAENAGIGYRTTMGTARVRIGRWLQELQRLRQARKEGAANIGLITAEMAKYLEGKDAELHAARQAGLIDFIASALPASHTSKPEACQVTIHLLKLLKVVLSVSTNRSYFLSQNMLPPIIPMLSAALENYIKIAVSLNLPGNTNLPSSKTSAENFESITQVLDGFLWTVSIIIGHINSEEQQIQMRDGLLELLTAYQVIHRLRDLFALYDRPQVEGSPFPSSILLSIYLLVVLTSRPETNYLIDWESFYAEIPLQNGSHEIKISEHADNAFPLEYSGDLRSSSSMLNSSKVVQLPDVPEDTPLHEAKMNRNGVSEPVFTDTEKEQTKYILEESKADGTNGGVSDECKEVRTVDSVKVVPPQKDEKNMADVVVEQNHENVLNLDQPVVFLLNAISETGLVSLLSVLTAVLLQANSRLSSDQGSYALPSNFEEVATGVLKVLNNLALLDLKFLQRMLARPDLKMEFFHLLSFLLTHCNSKWKTAGDQVGMLMLESLSLLGHFALFHPGNQAVLRWGKTPTILHKICDLPFVFFSDPELMPILASTLVAACYGGEQNKGLVRQEISTDMLLSLLKSCRNMPAEFNDNLLNGCELKKAQADLPLKASRQNSRNARVSMGKSVSSGNGMKNGKLRNQRVDGRATKSNEETGSKPIMPASETSSMMLHCRLSLSFIDKAEHFFSIADEV